MPIVNPSASPAIPGVTTLASVSLFSDVRALAAGQYPLVWVLGGTVAGDGKDGVFYWSASSLTADDGLTVLAPNAGATGRWIRLYSGFSLSSGASHVSTIQSGTGAVSLPLQTVIRSIAKTPQQYGAVANGSTDDTAAVQAAITAAGAGYVYFPEGSYKITSTLTVSTSGAKLVGAGRSSTKLVFAPTATGTLLKFSNGASMIRQFCLRDITLYSSDSTYTKTALEIIDGGEYLIDNVEIGGGVVVGSTSMWSGSNSIGINIKGREAGVFNTVWSVADRPLLISDNPNSTIDIDHHNFHNWQGIANGNPVVEIASGVNLSNVSFTGYQAWVLGTHGLYWVDTTTSVVSYDLTLKNVRWEQGTSAAAHLVHIEHNSGLYQLKMENCYGGADRAGYYLRKVLGVYWDSCNYTGTGVALDANATVKGMTAKSCSWAAGSTATLVGQLLIWGVSKNPNTGALPPEFYYDESANTKQTVTIGGPITGGNVTLAANATSALISATAQGTLFITASNGVSAIYMLNGSNHSVFEISDPAGQFTAAAGGVGTNIYWSAGNSRYEIENKLGAGTLSYSLTLIGIYEAVFP